MIDRPSQSDTEGFEIGLVIVGRPCLPKHKIQHLYLGDIRSSVCLAKTANKILSVFGPDENLQRGAQC